MIGSLEEQLPVRSSIGDKEYWFCNLNTLHCKCVARAKHSTWLEELIHVVVKRILYKVETFEVHSES